MRGLVQRVSRASVTVGEKTLGSISAGLLVFAAVSSQDELEDAQWLARKIVSLRIFPNEAGQMDLSLGDIGGDILLISQFTLYGTLSKGNRPSFTRSAPPEAAVPLFERLRAELEKESGRPVPTGEFGAHMEVSLVNDGPVTLILDSKNREL